jgi:hypothetical protein
MVAQAVAQACDADADAAGLSVVPSFDAVQPVQPADVQQHKPTRMWCPVQMFALRCVLARLPRCRAERRKLWPAVKTAFDRVIDHVIKCAHGLQWCDTAGIASVGPTHSWCVTRYTCKAYQPTSGLAWTGNDMIPEAVLASKLNLTEQDATNIRILTEEAFHAMGQDEDPHVRLDWLNIWTPAAQ